MLLKSQATQPTLTYLTWQILAPHAQVLLAAIEAYHPGQAEGVKPLGEMECW
jgi:hypothetical protein